MDDLIPPREIDISAYRERQKSNLQARLFKLEDDMPMIEQQIRSMGGNPARAIKDMAAEIEVVKRQIKQLDEAEPEDAQGGVAWKRI